MASRDTVLSARPNRYCQRRRGWLEPWQPAQADPGNRRQHARCASGGNDAGAVPRQRQRAWHAGVGCSLQGDEQPHSATHGWQGGNAGRRRSLPAGVRIVRGVGNLLGPRLLYTVTDAGNNIADWMTTRNVSKFADRIFGNPDAGISAANSQKFSQQAARLSPGSRELITRTAEFLGQQGGGTDVVSGRQPTPGSAPAIPPAPRNQMAPAYGP